MAITAEEVKDLRLKTGISIMECKNALVEAEGDQEKAIEIMRKKGTTKAAKKSERSTSEGIVSIIVKEGKGVITKLVCETDFVARNEDFVGLAQKLSELTLEKGPEVAKTESKDLVEELFTKLGENMSLAEAEEIEGAVLNYYLHSNSKVGTIVALEGGDKELAKDIAMHATAMNPSYVSPDEVEASVLEKEKEIWTEQLKNEGKPEEIIGKILQGKEKKFCEENSLIKQTFVKDPDKTVEQLLEEKGAKVTGFVRLSV